MAAAGAFACPRCRMAFGSRALLRAHRERLCLEGPGEQPGRAEGLRDPSVVRGRGWARGWDASAGEDVGRGRSSSESSRAACPSVVEQLPPSHPVCLFKVAMSQHEDRPKHRRLLLLSGLPRFSPGREGAGRTRGAPLGDVLTPRERALLRAPAASRPAERGEPSPPRGDPRAPELLEAHQRHVAEIRARTQRLEQRREQLCQHLALLCNKRLSPEMSRAAEVLSDKVGHQHRGAALHLDAPHLDTLLPPSGSLAAEARALRLSYLRAGGHDEATLAQLLDLQLEATALEKRAAQKTSKHQPQHRARGQDTIAVEAARGLDAALMAVELENQRLEDELLALKVRREMRADVGSLAARQNAELAQLQAKVEMLLRRQAEGMGPRLPPAVLPPPVAPPLPPAFALAEPLRTGSPTGFSRPLAPSSLPSILFGALDDPPPTQEAPAQHKSPERHFSRYI